jgi:single-strand DNA-binding protein
MNVGTFVGRVGRDAELRTTPSGAVVLNFSLANDVGYGERKATQWISCALWGEQRAEKLQQFIVKGKQLAVSGEVTVRAYATRAGEPAAEILLNVRELTLLGGRDAEAPLDEAGRSTPPRDRPASQRDAFGGRAPAAAPAATATADFDDDIPF